MVLWKARTRPAARKSTQAIILAASKALAVITCTCTIHRPRHNQKEKQSEVREETEQGRSQGKCDERVMGEKRNARQNRFRLQSIYFVGQQPQHVCEERHFVSPSSHTTLLKLKYPNGTELDHNVCKEESTGGWVNLCCMCALGSAASVPSTDTQKSPMYHTSVCTSTSHVCVHADVTSATT